MLSQVKSFAAFVLCLSIFTLARAEFRTGAEQTQLYVPKLEGKRVAVVANQTSTIGQTHLVDSLLGAGIDVVKVFAPEHGFRGIADAGEHVVDGKDQRTGLPIISLYGSHKEPTTEDLAEVDQVIFDIQDVGVRYYTYISTMHYVMQACAKNGLPLLILDRPNPNGHYIDGPVLDLKYQSFVGMHQIPLVHGMTVAELAQMINGEGWLDDGLQCEIELVKCKDYRRDMEYILPIKPSPNLPNQASIFLYPSLGIFEGTNISVARGTEFPFQAFGHPDLKNTTFEFTPKSVEGAKHPPYKGKLVKGFDLREFGQEKGRDLAQVYLNWVIQAYKNSPNQDSFFVKSGFFNLLAGTDQLRKQIEQGLSADEIRKTWQEDLDAFRSQRNQYLLYQD